MIHHPTLTSSTVRGGECTMIMMMTAPVMDTSGGISLPVLFQSTSVITGAELRTDTDRGGSTMTESGRRRKMNIMHKYKI